MKSENFSGIYKRIDSLCKENRTNISSLCIEVAGSSGNLSTWKKGHIRSDYLIKIVKKFNVSADYILGLTGQEYILLKSEEKNDMERKINPIILKFLHRLYEDSNGQIREKIEGLFRQAGVDSKHFYDMKNDKDIDTKVLLELFKFFHIPKGVNFIGSESSCAHTYIKFRMYLLASDFDKATVDEARELFKEIRKSFWLMKLKTFANG